MRRCHGNSQQSAAKHAHPGLNFVSCKLRLLHAAGIDCLNCHGRGQWARAMSQWARTRPNGFVLTYWRWVHLHTITRNGAGIPGALLRRELRRLTLVRVEGRSVVAAVARFVHVVALLAISASRYPLRMGSCTTSPRTPHPPQREQLRTAARHVSVRREA
jgi:hypothetical protein